MKINKITISLLTMAVLALPLLSLANTYQFVNTSGQLQTVEAVNATVALDTAYRLGAHSGVMLVSSK